MTTVAELITRTRNDYLTPSEPDSRNKLNGAVSDSATTLTFTYPLNGIGDGSKISLGLEDIHVWTTEEAVRTAEVDRGEYGTTAASHSDGATVLVNPRYTDSQIVRALNASVSMMTTEGIHAYSTVELTHDSSVNGYDLTSSTKFLDVTEAYWEAVDTTAKAWRRLPVQILRDANTADFASGTGILVNHAIPNGVTIRVKYSHELDPSLAALTDVVETVTGLEASAVDILCIGAALTLTAGKEIALNETDSARPRRSRDVPPGSFSQADSNLQSLWRSRVRAERGRLNRKHNRSRVRQF